MEFPRRQFLHLAAGAAALPAVSRCAWAQAGTADSLIIVHANVIDGVSNTPMMDATVIVATAASKV
jgi:hypothetical protein